MSEAMTVHARRKIEKRELWLYFVVAFLVFLPIVVIARGLDLFRGRSDQHRGSIFDETNERAGGLLGFVFMA